MDRAVDADSVEGGMAPLSPQRRNIYQLPIKLLDETVLPDFKLAV
ncbi:MAG: hypothetical protein AAF329_17325 [Cyanobacteria bacterium P01_A01_bin.17]